MDRPDRKIFSARNFLFFEFESLIAQMHGPLARNLPRSILVTTMIAPGTHSRTWGALCVRREMKKFDRKILVPENF